MDKISIIVPVYNQQQITRDCIETVRLNTGTIGQDYEIIIIDNGSSPVIDVVGNGFTSGIKIIRNESNLGFPAAVNQGIRAASGNIIILLNNDCFVTPEWSELLLSRLKNGIIETTSLDDKTKTHLPGRGFAIVSPVTNYCAGIQQVQAPIYRDERELNMVAIDWQIKYSGQVQEVNWVIGFCMAFRRSLYDEFGPFDESLWPSSGEELNFCLSVRKSGYKIGIAKDCYIHHEGSQTFKAMHDAKQINYGEVCKRNDDYIKSKHGEFWSKQIVEGELK